MKSFEMGPGEEGPEKELKIVREDNPIKELIERHEYNEKRSDTLDTDKDLGVIEKKVKEGRIQHLFELAEHHEDQREIFESKEKEAHEQIKELNVEAKLVQSKIENIEEMNVLNKAVDKFIKFVSRENITEDNETYRNLQNDIKKLSEAAAQYRKQWLHHNNQIGETSHERLQLERSLQNNESTESDSSNDQAQAA